MAESSIYICMLFKLRNNYVLHIVNMFIWIDKGKTYKQDVYTFFLYSDNTDDFRLIMKTIWILKTILKITTFFRFSLIYLMIFWIEYAKVILKSNSLSINKKNNIDIKC